MIRRTEEGEDKKSARNQNNNENENLARKKIKNRKKSKHSNNWYAKNGQDRTVSVKKNLSPNGGINSRRLRVE